MKHSAPRSALTGASSLEVNTVTDHVSLSPASVSSEIVPSGISQGARTVGRDGPVKYRV